jgi:hypothetical protein
MINKLLTDKEFVVFRKYVNVLVNSLEQEAFIQHFSNKSFEEGCVNDFIRLVKAQAVDLYYEVEMEDDEYGTLAYTGYPRSYAQALEHFLANMSEFHGITPVMKNGVLVDYDYDVIRICRESVYRFNARNDVSPTVKTTDHLFGESPNDDLPF